MIKQTSLGTISRAAKEREGGRDGGGGGGEGDSQQTGTKRVLRTAVPSRAEPETELRVVSSLFTCSMVCNVPE